MSPMVDTFKASLGEHTMKRVSVIKQQKRKSNKFKIPFITQNAGEDNEED
jgi:hypothetical protein